MLQAIQYIKKALSPLYPEGEIRVFTRLMLEKLCNIPPYKQLCYKDIKISDFQRKEINSCIERLLHYEPIQYILGETIFQGLSFSLSPAVLIPRPETEELTEIIISNHEKESPTILDIGTGSGCIAVSLAKKIPNSCVFAFDISAQAVSIAKKNALQNDVYITFIQQDVFSPLAEKFPVSFDLIVSNPPYVMCKEKKIMQKNVLDFEPHTALFVPDNNPLVFYKRIAELANERLSDMGTLYLEINPLLSEETVLLIREEGLKNVKVINDLYQKKRFIVAAR